MSVPSPTARHPFEYSVLRVIPRVERAESVNAGVIVYCRTLDYLGARVHLAPERVRALDPAADVEAIRAALTAIATMCEPAADRTAADREIGARFRWLTAPRSTVVQPSPVHTGLTVDAAAELDRLLAVLVLPVG